MQIRRNDLGDLYCPTCAIVYHDTVFSPVNTHLVWRPLCLFRCCIIQADSVAVLQDGKVVEVGTYTELMSKEGGLLVNLMEGGGN